VEYSISQSYYKRTPKLLSKKAINIEKILVEIIIVHAPWKEYN
jgi:hypothetical protein